MKAQAASELLIMTSIALVALVILSSTRTFTGALVVDMDGIQMRSALDDLGAAADSVWHQADGALTTIYIVLPERARVTIANETIVIQKGTVITSRTLPYPIEGNLTSGNVWVRVLNTGDRVRFIGSP